MVSCSKYHHAGLDGLSKKSKKWKGITGGSCLHLDLYIMSQPMESFCDRKDMKNVEHSLINHLIIALRGAVENKQFVSANAHLLSWRHKVELSTKGNVSLPVTFLLWTLIEQCKLMSHINSSFSQIVHFYMDDDVAGIAEFTLFYILALIRCYTVYKCRHYKFMNLTCMKCWKIIVHVVFVKYVAKIIVSSKM